jgi:uncharacterized protein (DUF2249 family)
MRNKLQKHKILDINYLSKAHRDLRLLEAVLCLQPGCSFLIKLDEPPTSLIANLEGELNDRFQWKVLQAGPEVWLTQVTRRSNEQAA